MDMRYRYDVFLSYCRGDSIAAKLVHAELAGTGLRIFFDLESIEFGAPWQAGIDHALASSRMVVVLVGPPHKGQGEFQKREVARALQRSKEVPMGAVLLPEVSHQRLTAVGFPDMPVHQWFLCGTNSLRKLAEQICRQLGVCPPGDVCQFGADLFVAETPGLCPDMAVRTLANRIGLERLELTWETFKQGLVLLGSQLRSSEHMPNSTLVGVNPVGHIMASWLQQKLYPGGPVGYLSDRSGHESFLPAIPDDGELDRVLLVDSELKSGGSLLKNIDIVRKQYTDESGKSPEVWAVVWGGMLSKRYSVAKLLERVRPPTLSVLHAWRSIREAPIGRIVLGCVMDPPGTIRPMDLR